MPTLTRSLWLPVSRANFFNRSEDDWLRSAGDRDGDEVDCWSARIENPTYVPLVLVGVLRRLLEVLPRSFGYAAIGRCQLRGDSGNRTRPVDVTLTLDLTQPHPTPAVPDFWHQANDALVAAGVTGVTLFVSENGWYAFTATHVEGAHLDAVGTALTAHIRQVFGGDYVVHPLPSSSKRVDVGSSSLKEYSGLRDGPGDEDIVTSQPRGGLSFVQLNIISEGLWNDALSPAVYLEQREFMDGWLADKNPEAKDFIRSIADVIEALTTDSDATRTVGQIVTLHHFLTITAGGSLLKLQAALDSSRRRLLNEMLAALHRQSRLVQLQFSTNSRERRPELALGASETQLKGYATLVTAKFPLFTTTGEMIRLAQDHLAWLVRREGPIQPGPEVRADAEQQMQRLDGQVSHWNALIAELQKNVETLDQTIERAWQDALLEEEQQARSDQEAMAEIERSRLSRPTDNAAGRTANTLVTILLALFGVVYAAGSGNLSQLNQPDTGFWRGFWLLWPVWTVLIATGLIPAAIIYIRRLHHDRHGSQGTHPYQFSFRLDEEVDYDLLVKHVADRRRRPIYTDESRKVLKKIFAENRGYGRVEHSSADTTTVKAHTIITFHVSWFTFARFEVINEILMHKIARRTNRVLVQSRVFGESPAPLAADQVAQLLKVILRDVRTQLLAESGQDNLNQNELVDESLYGLAPATSPVPSPRRGDQTTPAVTNTDHGA